MGNICKLFVDSDFDIEIQSRNREKEYKEFQDSPRNEFLEIKEFRYNILKISIFQRKSRAINEYNKFIKEKNYNNFITDKKKIKDIYIEIMNLVLIDNTNKDIIKLYLNFLKHYSNFIKENDLLCYSREINKYKVLFTVSEMANIEPNIKVNSEKDNYISYLNYLSNTQEEEYLNIFNDAKDKFNKIYLFNLPIEFSNQELFYYKAYYIILYEIISHFTDKPEIDKNYIINKKIIIKYVLENHAFSNKEIILNEDKMNLLLLYIIKENNYDYINFNRLFQSFPIKKEEFLKFNNKKSEYANYLSDNEKEIKHKVSKFDTNKYINIPLEKVCLKNLNNTHLDNVDNPLSYYNIDTLFKENEINIFIDKIKKFLIKIIDSNTYQQAIRQLFPNDYHYLIINNNEDIKTYINERIKFYPFENLGLSGITDKLGCYSYIPTINFIGTILKNTYIYKIALTIINCTHEINHINQDLIYFKGNDKNLINTPEREGLEREGGKNLEVLLFGKTLEDVDLFQSLYILNERNYKQDLLKFNENFLNIKNIIKSTNGTSNLINNNEGIFKELFEISKDELKFLIGLLKNDSDYILPTMFIGKINQKKRGYKNKIKKCGLLGGWKKIY